METTLGKDEIALLLRRAGIVVPPEQLDELHRVAGYVDAMIARVRAAEVGDLPAHVFAPVEPAS